ncbi:indole-3-glycerol phosphate synthase TrpC [Pontibacillus marinus]|uniref:Indole-3-glycerol phosphate synthase n=1 Tax=Pontibacillus marinus BH030004 = DSM 16465 TaxID=1385511 RepID=A0A0A5GE32_9BACI|nr:indole-3-glycerol phosphate synthase TrpC [Pontibacillus marinus]KGX90264.1 indole-3-glycerol phosphate synthase [Pontibacillus marinus BH030004 = DSM 16465]
MLKKILDQKQKELEALTLPVKQTVEKQSFYEALSNHNKLIGLIAEVKKASPSKGIIREDFHPVDIAKMYEQAGAAAVSVLTDEQFFQGHRDFVTSIKQQIQLPVLRKDFIIDRIQVEESARIGADAILLIGEALDPNKLYDLYQYAESFGLDVLVEVHSEDTLRKVLHVFTPKILGVNNRDLTTFETTIDTTGKLASIIPKECLLVSESGLFTRHDLKQVKNSGAEAVLIGEALMRKDEPISYIRKLIGCDPTHVD